MEREQKGERKMEVTLKAKRGFELAIEVDGFKSSPELTVQPFTARGNKHPGGSCVIQHWTRKGLDPGICIAKTGKFPQIYVEMKDMADLKAAIVELPVKQRFIHKEPEVVNADGYKITIQKWHHDGSGFYEVDGYTISGGQMERFLDSQGVTKILVEDAIKLFAETHDIEELKRRVLEAGRRIQAAINDDIAEEGEAQARENWGTREVYK